MVLFWACANCQCFFLDGKYFPTLLKKFLEFCLAQLDHMHSTHDGAFSPVNSTSCYQLGLCKLLVFFNCDGIHSYFVEEISGILCLVSLSCSIGLHTFSTCDGAFSPVNSFFFNIGLVQIVSVLNGDEKFTPTLLKKFQEFVLILFVLLN